MKQKLFFLPMAAMLACQNPKTKESDSQSTPLAQKLLSNDPSSFIPVDSANKMLESYLGSINYPQNDSAVISFTFSISELRRLLDSVDHPDSLKDIQIRLAHSLEYINSGHQNMNAGYNKNALRLLISGVDTKGNTILLNNQVMNHSIPCPNSCPPGTAANPVFN